MADQYSTIQQHQPLRVPAGWDKQEKAFVIQLEETFDDIYRRFGRLGMSDMSKKFQIIIGNKYDKVSGITITEDGVDIAGSKYVKISSDDDSWTYDTNGLTYESDDSSFPFQVSNYDERTDGANGVFIQNTTGHGDLVFITHCANNAHVSQTGYWSAEIRFSVEDNADYLDAAGETISGLQNYLYSPNSLGNLGKPTEPWRQVFAWDYRGSTFTNNGGTYHQLRLLPSPIQDASRKLGATLTINPDGSVFLQKTTDTESFVVQVTSLQSSGVVTAGTRVNTPQISNGGSSTPGKELAIAPNGNSARKNVSLRIVENDEGNNKVISILPGSAADIFRINGARLKGGIELTGSSDVTDMNDYTDSGCYLVWFQHVTSNKPDNISATTMLEVFSYSGTSLDLTFQRIFYSDAIYTRYCYNGTWYPWYKFTGTAL